MIRRPVWLLAAPTVIVLAAVSWTLLLTAGVVGFGTGFFVVRKQRDDAVILSLELLDDRYESLRNDIHWQQFFDDASFDDEIRAALGDWGDRGGLA